MENKNILYKNLPKNYLKGGYFKDEEKKIMKR